MGWETASDYPQSEVEGPVSAAGAEDGKTVINEASALVEVTLTDGRELIAPVPGAGKTEQLMARITGLEAAEDIRGLRSLYAA